MDADTKDESLPEIWEKRTLPLPLRDAAVYLNSLCTATTSIDKILDLVRSCTECGSPSSLGIILQVCGVVGLTLTDSMLANSLSLLEQELERCRGQYQYLVCSEINITLAHRIHCEMEKAVEELLRYGGAAPLSGSSVCTPATSQRPAIGGFDGVFVISGDEADSRADSAVHNALTRMVTGLLGLRASTAHEEEAVGQVERAAGSVEWAPPDNERVDEDSWLGYCRGLRSLLTSTAYYEVC